MNWSTFDTRAMRRALELAARGLNSTQPNPRVGAVLAQGEQIVGEGFHERAGEPHAEPNAIRAAGARAHGATAYVTLEPCNHHGRTPPCVDALLAAGVARVVYAAGDPNPLVNGAGAARLAAAGVRVESGLLGEEAAELNAGFFKRMRTGRPFVRLKSAASLDGRVALANGVSQWITSDAARADVQNWRAQSAAVLTSAATVLADNPRMDVRIATSRQPLRVVLDRELSVPASARILQPPGATLVFASEFAVGTTGGARGTHLEAVPLKGAHLDLQRVLARLGELAINEVLVEAGGGLGGALLAAGLVDEWLLYLAPKLLGQDGMPLAELAGITALEDVPNFTIVDVAQVGTDLRLRLRPVSNKE